MITIKGILEKIGNNIIDSMNFLEQVLALYEEKVKEERERNN